MAFQDLNGAVEANADQLRQENDRLANTIARLEHKPQNLLAEALDEPGWPPIGWLNLSTRHREGGRDDQGQPRRLV